MLKLKISQIPFSFLIIFSLFIVYGTTIPFNFGGEANFYKRLQEICWIPFVAREGGRTSFSDVIQNIMLFMPIGFLGWLSLIKYRNKILNFFLVLSFGIALSFSVECLQLITVDRTTSVTDLITNSFGTVVGVIFCSVIIRLWLKIYNHQFFIKIVQLPFFVPLILLSFVIVAELLQPFDFALDLSAFYHKIKSIIANPIDFSGITRDGPFVILLFSTFSYLIFRSIDQIGVKISLLIPMVTLLLFNVFIESVQLVIRSRSPEVADILTGMAGTFLGLVFYHSGKKDIFKPGILLVVAFFVSFFCKTYYPFQISDTYQSFNWVPFLSEYSNTTMISLGNVMETFILFSFGGYIIDTLYKGISVKPYFSVLVLLLMFIVEVSQGWISGRFPDVSDILVGFAALLFGKFLSVRGEQTLRDALEHFRF